MNRLFVAVFLCALLMSLACRDKSSEKKVRLDPIMPAGAEKFTFGDNVRIRTAPETQAAGVAGRIGNVAGFTTPSQTRVEVIGEVKSNLAFSVIFEKPHAQLWFTPELLEFVDHAPGMDIQIGQKRWVRRADGGWDEIPK